jgi:hypothetical protein
MQAHQDADRLIQDIWLYEGKGCFFGCAMQTDVSALDKAIKEMQLPAWLVYLSESIFEGLPQEEAIAFPVQLLKAIPHDTEIIEAMHKIAIKRLEPLIREPNGEEVNTAIQQVIDYHKNTDRTEDERHLVHLAANSAVDLGVDYAAYLAVHSAVHSAAANRAYSAVRSAGCLAASLAARSARSAVRLAASSAAEAEAWQKERDNLIAALKEL